MEATLDELLVVCEEEIEDTPLVPQDGKDDPLEVSILLVKFMS